MKKYIYNILGFLIFVFFLNNSVVASDCEVCGKWIWTEGKYKDPSSLCIGELNVYRDGTVDFYERCIIEGFSSLTPLHYSGTVEKLTWTKISEQAYEGKVYDLNNNFLAEFIVLLSSDKNIATIIKTPYWVNRLIAYRDITGKGIIQYLNETYK